MPHIDEKRRYDYDQEKENGHGDTQHFDRDLGESKSSGGPVQSTEDVFIEKEEHQIHYKTLTWQVSRVTFDAFGF